MTRRSSFVERATSIEISLATSETGTCRSEVICAICVATVERVGKSSAVSMILRTSSSVTSPPSSDLRK